MINIIVCVKQIPDPDTPPASFKVDPNTNKVIPSASMPPVISPFDAIAAEAALQIKDKLEAKITAISLGPKAAKDVIKQVMSMGADEGYLLDDPGFADGDSYSTAFALTAAIKKIGEYDLILCGRQAADWDAGQVSSGIAELLELPSITLAKKVDVTDGTCRVERLITDGYEVVETSLPAVISVANELGVPRYPTLKGIMAVSKRDVPVWTTQDLGLSTSEVGAAGARIKLQKLYIPVREGKCEVIEGESLEEAAVSLALKLRDKKII